MRQVDPLACYFAFKVGDMAADLGTLSAQGCNDVRVAPRQK
jgi:hypothetical protein